MLAPKVAGRLLMAHSLSARDPLAFAMAVARQMQPMEARSREQSGVLVVGQQTTL